MLQIFYNYLKIILLKLWMILYSSSDFDSILKIESEKYWNLIKTFY